MFDDETFDDRNDASLSEAMPTGADPLPIATAPVVPGVEWPGDGGHVLLGAPDRSGEECWHFGYWSESNGWCNSDWWIIKPTAWCPLPRTYEGPPVPDPDATIDALQRALSAASRGMSLAELIEEEEAIWDGRRPVVERANYLSARKTVKPEIRAFFDELADRMTAAAEALTDRITHWQPATLEDTVALLRWAKRADYSLDEMAETLLVGLEGLAGALAPRRLPPPGL